MRLTVHRYEFDSSYVIEKLNDRFKIDFSLADSFHREMITLDYGLEDILSNLFHKDDAYGTLLEVRQDVMLRFDTDPSHFDFVVDLFRHNMGIFYNSDSIYSTLKKLDDNRQFLIDRKMVYDPSYLQQLDPCLAFVQKAKDENNLIHFWNQ